MEKIRLLVVSEDSSSRKGLNAIFTSEDIFEVLNCMTLNEAAENSVLLQPDAILIDINDDDVIKYEQKIKQIKSECPCTLIIAMIENEQCVNVDNVLMQVVDSCIPKGIMRGCLIRCVELACQVGIFCFPGSVKKKFSLDSSSKILNNGFKSNVILVGGSLTKRELEILQLMALNYSNREIAQKLYISEPTVKTHVSSILRKLGKNNRAQAVLYSYKVGLVSDPQVVQKI